MKHIIYIYCYHIDLLDEFIENCYPLIEKYNLKTYFETGTGQAISLRHALNYKFENMKHGKGSIKHTEFSFLIFFFINSLSRPECVNSRAKFLSGE